jgi:hypothetical protein
MVAERDRWLIRSSTMSFSLIVARQMLSQIPLRDPPAFPTQASSRQPTFLEEVINQAPSNA